MLTLWHPLIYLHSHPKLAWTHGSLSCVCQHISQSQHHEICTWLSHCSHWGSSACSKPYLQLFPNWWQIFQWSGCAGMLYLVHPRFDNSSNAIRSHMLRSVILWAFQHCMPLAPQHRSFTTFMSWFHTRLRFRRYFFSSLYSHSYLDPFQEFLLFSITCTSTLWLYAQPLLSTLLFSLTHTWDPYTRWLCTHYYKYHSRTCSSFPRLVFISILQQSQSPLWTFPSSRLPLLGCRSLIETLTQSNSLTSWSHRIPLYTSYKLDSQES